MIEGGVHNPAKKACWWPGCAVRVDAKCLRCGQTFCRKHIDDHLKTHYQADTETKGR